MRDLLLLVVQLIVTLAKLARPGGVRSVIAESLLLKHELIVSGRSRRRAPPLTTIDRFVLGFMVLFLRPPRVAKLAAVLKPATLLRFHKALVDRKYRRLFSSTGTRRKLGPKGPTKELISAILEMKLRNPRFGHQRIASACDTRTRHWVRCVLCWLVFPSALVLRSTDSAAVPSPALFIGLIATLTKSDFLGSFIVGYGSLPSRRGPVMLTGQPQDLPVPETRSFRTCQGLRPRRVTAALALARRRVLPST